MHIPSVSRVCKVSSPNDINWNPRLKSTFRIDHIQHQFAQFDLHSLMRIQYTRFSHLKNPILYQQQQQQCVMDYWKCRVKPLRIDFEKSRAKEKKNSYTRKQMKFMLNNEYFVVNIYSRKQFDIAVCSFQTWTVICLSVTKI